MRQMIAIEFTPCEDRIHEIESCFRAIPHRHRHRAVQLHHGRWLDAQQDIVDHDNLRPVRRRGRGGMGVNRSYRRLQGVRTETARQQCPLHQRRPFGNMLRIPERAVLVFEQDETAFRGTARRVPRFLQQHQRKQSQRLGLRQQFDQQPAQANRLAGKAGARERFSGRCRIALVENQINHPQHALHPIRQFRRRRHLVRDAGIPDFCLGPDDTLGKRGCSGKECPGDLLGCQPAYFAQGKRHLGIGRESGMTAGKDKPEAVVLDPLAIRVILLGGEMLFDVFRQRLESCPAPQAVDSLEAPDRNEPRTRILRNSVARPLLQRCPEGVMQRLFRHIEIPEQANEGGEDMARMHAIDGIYRLPGIRHAGRRPIIVLRSNRHLSVRVRFARKEPRRKVISF